MNWKLIEDKSWCSLEQLFEWVREMNTVQQDIRYHAEGSVAEHTRMVLEALQQSSAYHSLSTLEKEIIWTSALLHDVEKESTLSALFYTGIVLLHSISGNRLHL